MAAPNGSKLTYKPTKSSGGQRPAIPQDKWTGSSMPRNGFKAAKTQAGDPMLNIPIKLGTPDDPEHSSYKGATETFRCVFYDDSDGSKARAANFMRGKLKGLCEAVEVEYDEVYPQEIESEDDFMPLIKALEGKTIPKLWTTNREAAMPSGETVINVDLFFSEPRRRGTAVADEDAEEEDEAPARKPAKKSKR